MDQGDSLSPTIFNVVVDTVVCHLVFLGKGGTGGQDGWGSEVLHRAAFFYLVNVLVMSTDPVWMQGAFDTLTGLFDRVGLQKNFRKEVKIICCPFRVVGTQLEAAYKRHIIGEVLTYRDRQRL